VEPNYALRLAKLRAAVKGVSAVLLLSYDNDANAYYYTGNEVDPTILLATAKDSLIASLQPENHSAFGESIHYRDAKKELKKRFKALKGRRVGFDDSSPNALRAIKFLEKQGTKPVALGAKISEPRVVKEACELERVRKAQEITLRALAEADTLPNRTENAVAGRLESAARRHGGALNAFPPMVLCGERSALYHNTTTNRRIRRGESVLIDCGATFERYCADYTRTHRNGNRSAAFTDAYNAVEESLRQAKRKARAGTHGRTVGAEALAVIKEYGFELESHKAVGLALGHHVGLKVHDGPRLEERVLRKGMVVTIEPGIYVPGKYGIRIEDTIII